MLALSRQTRKEALPIFYTENTFRFDEFGPLVPFFVDRPSETLRCIESIELGLYVDVFSHELPGDRTGTEIVAD